MTRILVVEDSPTQAQQLQFHTGGRANFSVELALPNAEIRAAKRVADQAFDMIISDIMMPGPVGLRVVATASRRMPRGSIFRLILLSTLADPMDIIRGLECGCRQTLSPSRTNRSRLIDRIQNGCSRIDVREFRGKTCVRRRGSFFSERNSSSIRKKGADPSTC